MATDLGLPHVVGIGPAGFQGKAEAPGNVPRFGALWRIYQVDLPASAAVLVPSSYPALIDHLTSEGVAVPPLDPAIEGLPNVNDYLLRVALDSSCFADAGAVPGGCVWLGSQ